MGIRGLTVFFLFWCATCFGVTIIGSSSNIPLPPDANWGLSINFKPTSNEVVYFNPPIFNWCYTPSNATAVATDTNQYNFVLQIGNDPTFASPEISLITSINFYNWLPPLSPTNGTQYWRVGYVNIQKNTTNAWITNTFLIDGNATNWDRSGFVADAAAHAVHPYMLISNKNALSISNWLETNQIPWVQTEWAQIQSDAVSTFSQSWYAGATAPQNWNTGDAYVFGSHDLLASAFMWRITTNSYWTNQSPTPMSVLTNLAYYFLAPPYYDQADDVSVWDPFPEVVTQFAFLYDWYYDAMDAGQRAYMLTLIRDYANWIMYGYNWFCVYPYSTQLNDGVYYPGAVRDYSAPYYSVLQGSDMKNGDSHQHQVFETRYPMFLAAYGDDPAVSNAWVVGCNYYLGVGFYDGHTGGAHEPRDYNQTAMYGPGAVGLMTWFNSMLTGSVFPEGKIQNNPFFHLASQFTDMLTPVEIYMLNDPFSDGMESLTRDVSATGEGFFKGLGYVGMLTGDGEAYSHFLNQSVVTGALPNSDFYSWTPFNFLMPYYFPPPTPVTNSTSAALSHVFPVDGWVEAVSSPPNQNACFSNGVGIINMARPAGMAIGGHAVPADGNFQIWAYGSDVTDSGEWYNDFQARYVRCSWCEYVPTIDGIGQLQNPDAMTQSWYSRITAYTNGPNFVYWAEDLTGAYPVNQRSGQEYYVGGQLGGYYGVWPSNYIKLAITNTLFDVTNVTRSVLFYHSNYFVIHDEFDSISNHTWTELYHVMEPTISSDYGPSFTYTSSNQLTGLGTRPVTTYVYQVVESNLFYVTNMTGTNVKGNPITGENYYWLNPAPPELGPADENDPYIRTTAKWISNKTPTNHWHSIMVIYPVPPGGTTPTFNRLDDCTVAVTNGVQGDVISFNPSTPNIGLVTLLIAQTNSPPPSPPGVTNYNFIFSP